MTSKRRKRRKHLRSLLRSSNARVTSIWTGKDRPATPWVINSNLHRTPRKKRKTPRVLRHR